MSHRTILGLDLNGEPPRIRVVRLQPRPVPYPLPQEERCFFGLADFAVFWRSLALVDVGHPRLVVAAALEAHDPEGVLPWLEGQGAVLQRHPTPLWRGLARLGGRYRLPFFAWTAYSLALQAAYLQHAPEHLEAIGHGIRQARASLDDLTDRLSRLAESLRARPSARQACSTFASTSREGELP